MTRFSLTAIENEIKNIKKMIAPQMVCISFIDTTNDPCIFTVQENVYRIRADPEYRSREITAATLDEAVTKYRFPEGCDAEKSILFINDYGAM